MPWVMPMKMRRRKKEEQHLDIADVILAIIAAGAVVLGAFLCAWTEWQTAGYDSIARSALKNAVEVADTTKLDPSLEGKLVHMTGRVTSGGVTDDVLGVHADDAFVLERKVSYYQIVETKETKKDADGHKEVRSSYSRKWVGGVADSARFYSYSARSKAKAPICVIKSGTIVDEKACLGAYVLPADLSERLPKSDFVPKIKTKGELRAVQERIGCDPEMFHYTDKGFYLGDDVSGADLGDVRIRYRFAPAGDVSVLAVVRNGSFVPYRISKTESINMYQIVPGVVPLEEMVGEVDSDVGAMAWILRIAGFIIMAFGFIFLIETVAEKTPLRYLISPLKEEKTLSDSVRLAAGLALLIAGVFWTMAQPVKGGILLALALGIFVVPPRLASRKIKAE